MKTNNLRARRYGAETIKREQRFARKCLRACQARGRYRGTDFHDFLMSVIERDRRDYLTLEMYEYAMLETAGKYNLLCKLYR